jgi:hypothetical protein
MKGAKVEGWQALSYSDRENNLRNAEKSGKAEVLLRRMYWRISKKNRLNH